MSALATGDRVIRTTWPRGAVGTVVKVSPKTALVRFDDTGKDERVDLESIRPETDEDRAKRDHDAAMRAWEESAPDHVVVTIDRARSWYNNNKVNGFLVCATTPNQMRTAADELRALADWFERRPESSTP